MFHGEDAAEAAAIFSGGQIHDLGTFDVCEQRARLTVNVHAAQKMTGWVIGECSIPACANIGDAELVHKIFGEFEDTFTQGLGARQPNGIILK